MRVLFHKSDNVKEGTNHTTKREEAKWPPRELTMRKDFHNCLKENVLKRKATTCPRGQQGKGSGGENRTTVLMNIYAVERGLRV